MRLRWTILGYEITSLEFDLTNPAELLAEAIADLVDDEDEEPPEGITSGSGQNFERDINPVSPDDRYAPWDDRFGFR